MAKKLTSSKAREILHDKSVHGHPLTDKQRRFFGAIAGGAKPYKAESGGWLDKYTPKAQNGIEGTMGGLTDIGFNYNGAWGGPSMQQGGNLTFLEPTSRKLPMGHAFPYKDPSTELAISVGGEGGEPAYLIPSFKYGKYLTDKDAKAEFRKTGEHLGGPFKTWQEADEWERTVRHPYVEKGQSIPTPLRRWGKDFQTGGNLMPAMAGANQTVPMYQMGGVLPGAVGFTYARTAGAAPANGPYAKKTKASAQNGMEMKYYQEGLDFKPKTISQDGTVIDPMGYWNPDNVGNPVIIPSNVITMEGVDQPLIGISDTGDVQYMQPGEDYSFDGEYVTEYPVAQKGISVPAPTTSDSTRLYNAQMALNKFYEDEMKAGRIKKRSSEPMFGEVLKDYDQLQSENLSFYRQAIELRKLMEKAIGKTADDDTYKSFFNLSPEQVKKLEYEGLGKTKSNSKYQQYYRDLVTPRQNLAAPFALVDKRIVPQRLISYSPTETDHSYPGGDVMVYDYDPLAIKPYNMRTPQEKIEWEKKYGKPKLESKPQVKPQVKPQPKKEVEKKQEVVKKQEPITPVVERRQNVYEGTPVYSPGAGSGLGSALIGFMGPKGDTTYIKPEDYERFAVPKYGKEYIEKKKMKNGGVSVNMADQYPIEKLDQSLNFTNYNKPTKGGWLDKYK
ncbi:MAG: hypothetical protein EBR30_01955 [Cytophagia bacterium]|nr:hypothetical protein [Cytophagia bacterium]